MTFIIAFPIHKLMGFRVSQEQEVVGVDLSLHAETAYEFGVGGHGGSFQPLHELITGKPLAASRGRAQSPQPRWTPRPTARRTQRVRKVWGHETDHGNRPSGKA